MDRQAKKLFKMAAAKAGMQESVLATRLLGDWAQDYLDDKVEVPKSRLELRVGLSRPGGSSGR